MRTIKFRGKNLDGEWVYGFYVEEERQTLNGFEKKYFIVNDGYDYVKPDTVGQFTGLHDKDGKEIYEGDIIEYTHEICIEDGPGTYVGVVGFCEGVFCLHEDSDATIAYAIYHSEEYGGICVIGNIHDNPELLTNK